MARDNRGPDHGRVKVRVIEFEMDGSNQTLRDSIRDIVGAIGRAPLARAPVKALTNTGGASAEPQETEGVIIDAEEADETPTEPEVASGPKKRSATRSPLILEIDLKQGSISLMEFLEKIKPSSDVDRYACIAYWLKSNAGITEVGMDHMHTGYRAMKWNTPADAAWPLRSMKKTKYGYMRKGSKSGLSELTHIGENHVSDLMKAAGLNA